MQTHRKYGSLFRYCIVHFHQYGPNEVQGIKFVCLNETCNFAKNSKFVSHIVSEIIEINRRGGKKTNSLCHRWHHFVLFHIWCLVKFIDKNGIN